MRGSTLSGLTSSKGFFDSAVAVLFVGRGDSMPISSSGLCLRLGLPGRRGLADRRGL